jgi:hypothetical protein
MVPTVVMTVTIQNKYFYCDTTNDYITWILHKGVCVRFVVSGRAARAHGGLPQRLIFSSAKSLSTRNRTYVWGELGMVNWRTATSTHVKYSSNPNFLTSDDWFYSVEGKWYVPAAIGVILWMCVVSLNILEDVVVNHVYIHTTHAISPKGQQRHLRHYSETSTFYQDLAMRNTANVTDGKPTAVRSQSISDVSANNTLDAFYDIHERKREVLSFVLSRTPQETVSLRLELLLQLKIVRFISLQ